MREPKLSVREPALSVREPALSVRELDVQVREPGVCQCSSVECRPVLYLHVLGLEENCQGLKCQLRISR